MGKFITERNQDDWIAEFISFLRKKDHAMPDGVNEVNGVKGIALSLCFLKNGNGVLFNLIVEFH